MHQIETERLLLKLYKDTDKADLIMLLTDKVVMKYVDTGVFSREKARALWHKLIDEFYPQGFTTIFGVFAKDDLRYVGHAAIRPRPTKKEDWEISYILKTDDWGKGFATEIARNLIKFGFDELNLTKVLATIDDDNLVSIKVVKKAGMDFLRWEFDDEGRFSVYSVKNLSNQS